MRFWIEVSSATGTRTGRIDNALYWRYTPRLDRAGEIGFAIPAGDEKAALLSNKVRVACYAVVNGDVTEMGAGIVERITTEWTATGAVLTVEGADLLRELAIHLSVHGVGSAMVEYSNSVLVPDLLIDLAVTPTFPANWTLDGAAATATAVYLRIWHDSILNGLIQTAAVTGEHFRLGPSRKVVWLGPSSSFLDSGIVATTHGDPMAMESNPNACMITNITQISDSWDQWNRIYIFGAGEGESRLDLRAVENWPTGLTDATSGTSTMTFTINLAATSGGTWNVNRSESYLSNNTRVMADGPLVRAVLFKNIAPLSNTDADLADAADQLLRAGYHYLRTHITAQQFYRLSVTGLNTMIDVGETVRVMARGVYQDDAGRRIWLDIDQDLIVLETEQQIDATGLRTIGLTVSTVDRWPETDESAVIEPLAQVSAALSLPQLSANLDTVTFEQPVDDTYSATVHFWLPSSVTTVSQVKLRFRVDPLRSTVRTVGGAASVNVSIPNHVHEISVGAGSAGAGTAVEIIEVGGVWYFIADTGISRYIETQAGTGAATGSVDLSSAITTTYGIFEESGGNTYAYSDLEFSVNGVAATGTVTAISGASGWYELDLTADLVDSKDRPTSAANYVTIAIKTASKVNKTVRVTGEIERRTNIQSLALV